MQPARPGAPVPALLLLALVLAPRGTQGRPGGLRGAHVAGEEPKPSLPAASRSAEIFPRDLNLKDKFIKHFTEVISLSKQQDRMVTTVIPEHGDRISSAGYSQLVT
ncbi:hypothetical protein MG293_010199 [Ovis ammon polii]|uniref:Uncharacterized protein n=1 Tax=Ovis ammon polii TaxID=230172 RepID=A0AAD4U869_OVIAM|nr:hypothetical protein MG293_010199 [Ovis ammon polii]